MTDEYRPARINEANDAPGEMPKNFLIEDASRDFASNERWKESVERRLRIVERRGSLLPSIDEENAMFYLMVAYIVFSFILPAVFRLFGGKDVME